MDNLTDYEWSTIKNLFPVVEKRGGGRPAADPRAVLDAIRWIERTGERWLHLPASYPPQQTCYAKYLQWKRSGLLAEVNMALREMSVAT